jgi:hypothetical protein
LRFVRQSLVIRLDARVSMSYVLEAMFSMIVSKGRRGGEH